MEVNFTNFQSEIFEFLIGKDRVQFHIHGEAFARLSPPLESLIYGDWLEKSKRRVEWKHVSPDTFKRLCEFAYSGDYNSPMPTRRRSPTYLSKAVPVLRAGPRQSSKNSEENKATSKQKTRQETQNADDDVFGSSAGSSADEYERSQNKFDGEALARDSEGKSFSGPDSIENAFRRKSFVSKKSARAFKEACSVESNERYESFEKLLIAHGELYCLAKERMINDLCMLCLSKIHTILEDYKVNGVTILDVIALTRHVYMDERTGEDEDQLRDLLAEFFAWRIKDASIGGTKHFVDLGEGVWRLRTSILEADVLAAASEMRHRTME